MITYSEAMVRSTLSEICKKYTMTQNLVLQKIDYKASKELYIIITGDNSKHVISKELINGYIESLGDKGGLEIAALLLHPAELALSTEDNGMPNIDEYWEGNIQDINDYLDKKKKEDGSA